MTEPGPTGGRPSPLYRPTGGSSLEAWQTSQTSQTPRARIEKRGLPPLTALPQSERGTPFGTPSQGTPVERLVNGAWANGWVVAEAASLHAVKIAQLGNPLLTIGNMRWGVDVRACASTPSPVEDQQPDDPFDF